MFIFFTHIAIVDSIFIGIFKLLGNTLLAFLPIDEKIETLLGGVGSKGNKMPLCLVC